MGPDLHGRNGEQECAQLSPAVGRLCVKQLDSLSSSCKEKLCFVFVSNN